MRRAIRRRPPRKGTPIRCISGAYMGCIGWLDVANGATALMVYVIVATDEGEIPTRIARGSVVEDLPPGTYVEAALQQHPALLSNMVKLCKQLAECKLDGTDEDELGIMFATRLSEAVEKNKGSRARFRSIEWNILEASSARMS
jgi:hypothetical protein